MDNTEASLLTVAGILGIGTSIVFGGWILERSIERDCNLINAFRINGTVYSCMREYDYNEYS